MECEKIGGILATINSDDENYFVTNITQRVTDGAWHVTWIGLHRNSSGLTWIDSASTPYIKDGLSVTILFTPDIDNNCYVLMIRPEGDMNGWEGVNCDSTVYKDGYVCSRVIN
uniref:C-type lectin domain-containing protein n=1 Tax=Acrobeloides nanus TaxID=290746 RepID=A0A914C8C2_9BILA